MIRDQNYVKVAQYTQKAFQVFAKRLLASRILSILEASKLKKQATPSQQYIQVQSDSGFNQFSAQKSNLPDENDSLSKNTLFTKQQSYFQKQSMTKSLKIRSLKYGDLIWLDFKNKDVEWRVCSVLDTIKMFNTTDSQQNVVNMRRSCFELCSPSIPLRQTQAKPTNITPSSMVCLKNIFTQHYVHLTDEVSFTNRFGYCVKLKPSIEKQAVFRFKTAKGSKRQLAFEGLLTDQPMSITSYYQGQLYLMASQQHLDDKVDYTIIGSYNQFFFRVQKIQQLKNIKNNPYFYIHCVGINKNLSAEQPCFTKFMSKKEFNKIQYEIQSDHKEKQIKQHNKMWKIYEMSTTKIQTQISIEDIQHQSLTQIWQIQKIEEADEGHYCLIKNVVLDQPLRPKNRDYSDSGASHLKNSLFRFQRRDNDQFTILNHQNINLTAFYDRQTQKYLLKYDQQTLRQAESLMGKGHGYRFQLMQLQPSKCSLLYELIELNQILKSNYNFIQKWGFQFQQREFKLKYLISQLKAKLNLLRIKIKQVVTVIDRLKAILLRQDNNLQSAQLMIKQIKILQLMIYYSRIIKLKIGHETESNKSAEKLASRQMKHVLLKIFDLIYYLVFNNKVCSQVIIENSKFFSFLLLQHPEPIGLIIEEAIKNLCILSKKTLEEEDQIFRWTSWIEPLNKKPVQIQKKYMDIIAEVVVDPNDMGILPYQNKIKQLLLSHRTKKKIIPKFTIRTAEDQIQQPIIIFQYDNFPIQLEQSKNPSETRFQLRSLYRDKRKIKEYAAYQGYICSFLKLMRNLCKDRNKKLAKIAEDIGLTQSYMNLVFKNQNLGYELIAKFLDLYCSIHIVQDPFLCFEKRSVKCYSWPKIKMLDFSLKTSILFIQFTEQKAARQKLKNFDLNILSMLDRYFNNLQNIKQNEDNLQIQNSFFIMITVLYEIVDYGYLNHLSIQKYIKSILNYVKVYLKNESKREKQEKIIIKITKLIILAEQIWTILQGMSLLKTIYNNLCVSKITSIEYLVELTRKALNHDQTNLNAPNKFRTSNIRSSKGTERYHDLEQISLSSLHPRLDDNVIQFTLIRIIQNKLAVNSTCVQELMNLIQLISQRGERICQFLEEIFILNNQQQQNLYLQYSGITPEGLIGDSSSSSRRLQNVMKVKELVDKITTQNGQWEDQSRKKQKILQLNNLLIKIINNLTNLKEKHYQLFRTCQTLLQKLKLHTILIQVMKYYDKDDYQQLISKVITFYIYFVDNNPQNLSIMAAHFSQFTKRYSYEMLPDLLPSLFTKTPNQEEAFWLVYRNLDRKIEATHRQIVFQCIYRMIKVCSPSLFQNIKGQIIYTLVSNSHFYSYINGEVCCPSFVSLICLVGQGSLFVKERVAIITKKFELLEKLKDRQNNYVRKWIYLKIYHYLFIEQNNTIDQIQCEFLINEIIIAELKHLPASCHSRASEKFSSLDHQNLNAQTEEALYIKSQYRSLVIDGSSKIQPSEQQSYFIYLLNIQNQKQLSLLVFLEDLLDKYQIQNIEPLANYLFKIISFMEQLFLKQQKVYQSRILNKLYQISVIIQEKYNRSLGTTHNLTFKSAEPKVRSFFQKLSQIILKQNISYFQLLNCAQVTPLQVESKIRQQRVQKFVLQTDFLKFMSKLSNFVDNRSQYNSFASQSSIKQFYILFKEKGAHKLNIINFICKLIEVLEYQKSHRLTNLFSSSIKTHDLREKRAEELQCEGMNSELLNLQIRQLGKTFQMQLKGEMGSKIQTNLNKILEAINTNEQLMQRSIKYNNILQIHSNSQKYSIINLIVNQIFMKFNLQTAICSIEPHSWSMYFKFVARYIECHPEERVFDVLTCICNILQENKDLYIMFVEFMITIILKIYSLIKVLESSRATNIYNLFKKVCLLIATILSTDSLPPNIKQNIQIAISQTFIDAFSQFMTQKSIYWFKINQLILQKMIEGFDKCEQIVKVLSNSSDFINNFLTLINDVMAKDLMNTNIQSQNSKKIANYILKLIKKINLNGHETELSKIIVGFPYDVTYETVKHSYNLIRQIKQTNGVCDHQQECSRQFCNEVKVTDYDEQVVDFIVSLVVILHIAACLINNSSFQTNCKESSKQILSILYKWKNGTIKNQEDFKYFRFINIVKSIQVCIYDQKRTMYYSVPLLDKYRNIKIQEQIQQDLSVLARQNFFQSLYLLSIQAEQKLRDYLFMQKGFLLRLCFSRLEYIHYACILYLGSICINQIYQIIDIPTTVLYFFNSIILLIKISIFVLDFVRFILSYKVVSRIQFVQYTRAKKYSRLFLSFIILISYAGQYAADIFYPITFCLEISKISVVEQIVIIFLKSCEVIFYPFLFSQSFILICCYFIYNQGSQDSLITILITLEKQIGLYINQNDEFKMLKSVPMLIILFYMLLITVQAIFIAKVLAELGKLATRTLQGNKICKICGRSKDYFESKGVNFKHHKQYQHNIWNYIQYFISLRNKAYLQAQDKLIKASIQKQDFRFLKIDYHI